MEFSFSTTTLGNASKTISLKELENWVAPDRAKMARQAYIDGNESLYKKLKCNLGKDADKSLPYGMCPAIMAHTSFIGESRNSSGCLQEANHVLVFDYDELKHCEDSYEIRHKLASDLLQKLLDDGAAFGTLSASGVGFWVAYTYPTEPKIEDVRDFKRYYDSMMELISSKYQLVFDPSCSNINRWRFLGVEPVKLGTGTFILPAPTPKERKQTKTQIYVTQQKTETLIDWLRTTDQLIGDVKPDGSFNIRCPWEDEHSCSTGESECGYSPDKGFHCFHGSCAHRTLKDFLQYQYSIGFAQNEAADHLVCRLLGQLNDKDIRDALIVQFNLEKEEATSLITWAKRRKASLDSIEAGGQANPARLAEMYFDGWLYDDASGNFFRPGQKPIAGRFNSAQGISEDVAWALCSDAYPSGLVTRAIAVEKMEKQKALNTRDGIAMRCEQLAKAWDGKDYINAFAERYWPGDAYVADRWRKHLIGGAAMWLCPGSKHDVIWVFAGTGSKMKSKFCERLAILTSGNPPCDLDIGEHANKDEYVARGKASIGVYEEVFGGTITKREGEIIKKVSSQSMTTVREAYARSPKPIYFRALQFAATNHADCLPSTDAQKRRYWVAPISTKPIAETDHDLAQMLGQAITIAQHWFDQHPEYRVSHWCDDLPIWMENDDELAETISRNSTRESEDNTNYAITAVMSTIPDTVFGNFRDWASYIATGVTGMLYDTALKAPFADSYPVIKHGCGAEGIGRRIKERISRMDSVCKINGKACRGIYALAIKQAFNMPTDDEKISAINENIAF